MRDATKTVSRNRWKFPNNQKASCLLSAYRGKELIMFTLHFESTLWLTSMGFIIKCCKWHLYCITTNQFLCCVVACRIHCPWVDLYDVIWCNNLLCVMDCTHGMTPSDLINQQHKFCAKFLLCCVDISSPFIATVQSMMFTNNGVHYGITVEFLFARYTIALSYLWSCLRHWTCPCL